MGRFLTIADAAAALDAGTVTSCELVEEALATADACSDLGVYITRFDGSAIAAAKTADAERSAGKARGPLHGIPLGIKDIISTVEGPSTAQSVILDPEWSAGEGDAPVVARLRAAGAVITGKVTTYEYAIGFPDPDKQFPIPRNPWNLDYSPGGSSSGTAAGVAAGLFLGGLGTDTGGSIRMPAAYCGITGLKATFGRVPKSGCVPLGYTLDHIGPMARSAVDCALMLDALAGYDASDPYASAHPSTPYAAALPMDLSGLTIGVDMLTHLPDPVDPALHPTMMAAIAALEAAGATIVDVTLPLYEEIRTAQMVIMSAEAATYHLPDLATRFTEYGAGARYFIGNGLNYTATDYSQAQRVRRLGQMALAELFAEVDIVVTPTSLQGAFKLADTAPTRPIDTLAGIQTQYWNCPGNPVMSIPIGFTEAGLPLGMQICGRPFAETTVLGVGAVFQSSTDWHLQTPTLVTA
jgi:aspartyl-tRNA(Asn)/glutamyl-tRNA(Gln) amidotransferase subunit A